MAELRRDDTIDAADGDRRPVEDASGGLVDGGSGRPRNVRIDERQQPLTGSQELGGTAPVVTNRRVVESKVLYEGPADGAPYGAETTTATDARRMAEHVPHAATPTPIDTRRSDGGTNGTDSARTTEARLNRGSERDREPDQPQAADLFPAAELTNFRSRWDQVQVSFVDDPEQAVKQADELVSSVVKRISDQFAEQRSRLEGQWHKQDNAATTEELRRSLRQYRVFFDRLLSL